MTIRTARLSDIDSIAQVEGACFPAEEAAPRGELAQRVRNYGNHFWLMFDGDRLVAFADGMTTDAADLADVMYENAWLHDENGAWQMIFGVNTLPEYRKRGYAGQLIERAKSDAKAQGRKGLVLTCKEKLLHYYAKFGFVSEGVCASTHGVAVWYQMRLTF